MHKQKIVIVSLPYLNKNGISSNHPPLSALTLKSFSSNIDNIAIIDFRQKIEQGKICLDANFFKNAVKIIKITKPKYLCFTANCVQYPLAIRIACLYKKLDRSSIIILGGHQATLTHKETLIAFDFVDIIVRGEAEITFDLLIKALNNGDDLKNVPNISFRNKSGQVVLNQFSKNMDFRSIPFPRHSLMSDILNEIRFYNGELPVEVGRGCNRRCSFCCNTLTKLEYSQSNKKSRDIVRFLSTIIKDHGIDKFIFIQDNFCCNRERIKHLSNLIMEYKIKPSWSCNACLNDLDIEGIHLMAKAGCKKLHIGIESPSQTGQMLFNKPINLDNSFSKLRTIQNCDMTCTCNFIIGYPGETNRELDDTLKLIYKIAYHFDKCTIVINRLHMHSKTKLAGVNIDGLYLPRCKPSLPCAYMPFPIYKQVYSDLTASPDIFTFFYSIKRLFHESSYYELIESALPFFLKWFKNTLNTIHKECKMSITQLWQDYYNYLKYKDIISKGDKLSSLYDYIINNHRSHSDDILKIMNDEMNILRKTIANHSN